MAWKRPEFDTNHPYYVRQRAHAIGRELRRHFEDTVHEAVPDDMLEILRKIDAKRGSRGTHKGS